MRTFILIGLLLIFTDSFTQANRTFFISNDGSDKNSGTINKPFATITKALEIMRDIKRNKAIKSVRFYFRKGVYEVAEPIVLKSGDVGTDEFRLNFSSYNHENVVISGGRAFKGGWVKAFDDKNIWKVKIEQAQNGNGIFRSLFANGRRLQRATSDTLFSKGPLPIFEETFKGNRKQYKEQVQLMKVSILAYCGFTYDKNDLDSLHDIEHAEAIVYGSWEASWESVFKIDNKQKNVYFKNPAMYPVGFFGPKVRYRIENSRDYFDKPGEWYLDVKNSELWYYAGAGENPNSISFTIPKIEQLLLLRGEENNGSSVSNIVFSGISFQYTSSPWGINYANNLIRSSPINYPGLDLKEGFSALQAALTCGESILLLNTTNCKFQNCSFLHLGSYAIRIGEYSSKNTIENCTISDCAGGGVILGFNRMGGIIKSTPYQISPSYNKVVNCSISNCSILFPSAVGVGIMQANHSTIANNEIFDLPYDGISVGWTFDNEENYTYYNLIQNNHIHHVMKILADGGGIYTIGKQTGTVFKGNYIHDIGRSENAIGSFNHGFFFDEASSDFTVDSNVVTSIKNADYRFNHADSSEIKWGKNFFEKSGTAKDSYGSFLHKMKGLHPLNNKLKF